MKGYVHIYTGNGKGKTTAAIGLSMRAICAGKKVYFAQFVKGMKYSEVKLKDYVPNFTIKQFGRDCFICRKPDEEDIKAANAGLEECKRILSSDMYDLVVLDEINIALYYELISKDEVIDMIKNRTSSIEVVLTGRYAPKEILDIADLITEMKEIKHYFYTGVKARTGIEN